MSKKSKGEGQTISLPDGRQLGYLIVGEGKPVFYFHGYPSSRLEVLMAKGIAGSERLQMIGVDRPGFGLSTFAHNRRFRDFAADVSFLADHLEIGKFALVGFSGGGHYVLTCAALLAERVTHAIAISALSLPPDASEMPHMHRMIFRLGTMPIIGTWLFKTQRNMFFDVAKDPDAFLKSYVGKKLLKELGDDSKFLLDASYSEVLNVFLRSMVEAYRQGTDGIRAMIQEWNLVKKGWDVDLSQIPSGLVHIWHSTADKYVPVSNAYKNAEVIPGAHLEIFENEGHFALFFNRFEKLGEILSS